MNINNRGESLGKKKISALSSNRGQGVTEYILLLVVLVGLVMFFKKDISVTVFDKINELKNMILGVKGDV